MRSIHPLVLIAISASILGTGWEARVSDDTLRTRIERNLEESGENRDALERVLIESNDDIFPGVAFLIANSAPVNLIATDADSLIEEVSLAYRTKELYSWAKGLDEGLFLDYVLPNQVSQEPLTYYRRFFLDNLAPVVDTVETGAAAAIAVNYWCGQRVRFKQTQRQDQGVFHTLSSGYGRCEEMMIVYISALRSVGIPAREAWTPYWATSDNNHAWTELWADGSWHYAGSCEPKPTLDNAWFNKTAKRAAVIMSSSFGVPETDELIYREREHYSIINSTPYYVESPAKLVVETGAESTDVFIAVFNFGAIRPIMRLNTGDSTRVTFTMGHGDYIVYAGVKDSFAWEVAHTEFGEETHLALKPAKGGKLDKESLWLRYPAE